jgi:subtilase family serine protease
VKHPFLNKLLVLLVIAFFVISYSPQIKTTIGASGDNWVAHPMHILQSAEPSSYPNGISPSQMRTAYNLPSTGGNGSTIAIIDAGDTPTIETDLTMFSSTFRLSSPTNDNFEIVKMPGVGSASGDWITETCLDVEWAHAIAPDAKILLIEAKSANNFDLLSAVDYARNRPDVVAVSMSWGGQEFFRENNADSHFTSAYGAVFFASSGDDGSSTGVSWPASSPNVVGVGGTILNFKFDGTVSSEIAWSRSGGGVSAYESLPSYQTIFGVTSSRRSVPDVSYDAGTGVAVYCGSDDGWITVGGTSAGAPQWAAIQALGLSATNTNLYGKAKSAYSSYFRDITSGTNGGYNATLGYDCVTGLGSPLTFDFSSHLTVSPTSGPAGGLITLNGVGFTPGSSVNISYLNPVTAAWVSIVNNSPITVKKIGRAHV